MTHCRCWTAPEVQTTRFVSKGPSGFTGCREASQALRHLSPSPEVTFSWADQRKPLIRTKNKVPFLNQEQAPAPNPLLHVPFPGLGWHSFPCPAGDTRMGFILHLNPPVLITTRPWAAPKAIRARSRVWFVVSRSQSWACQGFRDNSRHQIGSGETTGV